MPTETSGRLRAVVFDLDGTLVDSLPDIAAALNVALSGAGYAQLQHGDVRSMMGEGAKVLVSRALTTVIGRADADAVSDVLTRYLRAYDAAPCVLSRLYPGASEVLDGLAAQGIALAICTNKPAAITAHVLAALGVAQRFGCVVGGTEGVPLKPAPDMLMRALAGLGARPEEAVMVGDSAADARAACAAGTRVVLLRHGYGQDDLDGLGAEAVLPGFAEPLSTLARMTFAAA